MRAATPEGLMGTKEEFVDTALRAGHSGALAQSAAQGRAGTLVVTPRRPARAPRWPLAFLVASVISIGSGCATTSPADRPSTPSDEVSLLQPPSKGSPNMTQDKASAADAAMMKTAATLTTKVLAIGSWTAKATPETRPPVMPFEARDTMRLMLKGKIDQWFAKTDGSGAVFLMNVTDPAEAHALLEALPLGQARMMTFVLIPVGPLWPLGLLLGEPGK
jgi:hypothetical protein